MLRSYVARLVVSASVAAAALSFTPAASAAPLPIGSAITGGLHTFFMGSDTVKMEVRNDGSQALSVKVGDTAPMTIAPGKSATVKGLNGTPITVAETSGTHQAGEKLAQLDKSLNGATIVVK